MEKYCLLFIINFSLLIILGCGKPQDAAVPRREAFYRIDQYPAQYNRHLETPLELSTNACARFDLERKDDGSYWATVTYPRYRARIYYTFTPLADRDATALVENRLERMHLDLGNASDLRTEEYLNPNGVNIWTVYAPHAFTTPVKFLAMDTNWMVSGTAFLEKATNADSVAPVIEVLTRDVRYSLLNLGN
ncbi:MAG: hypothetical protein LIP09_11815 [Bacteroidales bacterium]|nr:hypothetical protein [Bacteroidales bacterium]